MVNRINRQRRQQSKWNRTLLRKLHEEKQGQANLLVLCHVCIEYMYCYGCVCVCVCIFILVFNNGHKIGKIIHSTKQQISPITTIAPQKSYPINLVIVYIKKRSHAGNEKKVVKKRQKILIVWLWRFPAAPPPPIAITSETNKME